LGRYFGPGDVVPELGDAVLGRKVGEVTDPVRTRDGWEVVKILDVRKMPLEAVQGKLARALTHKKMREARLEYVKELEAKFDVKYMREGIQAIVRPEGRDEMPDAPLVQSSQGVNKVGDPGVRKALLGTPQELLGDSAAVVAVLRHKLMADSLMVYEARSRGMDHSPEISRLRQETLDRITVEALRKKEVIGRTEITPEEIRKAYEKFKKDYKLPPMLTVSEILVDSLSRAKSLRARILAGESMGDLAWQFSRRAGAQGMEGRWVVNPAGGEGWGSLLDRFKSAPVGQLMGPVKVENGYSLFRVEERRPARIRTLKEVEPLVRYRIRQRKIREAFAQYTKELMEKYADQITWYDDRIKAAAGKWI